MNKDVKILIMEDEEVLRDVYKEEFDREGFSVETAVDGEDGMKKMEMNKPDILLLDMLMPKMSGFDVLKVIKENPSYKDLPIIVFTNIYTDSQDLVKNWGAAYVLLKVNYTAGQLVEKVREVLKI